MCNALHTSWPQCPRTVPNLYHSGWQIQPKRLVSKNSIGLWCPATCCCCRKPCSRHIWSGAHYISIIYHIHHAGTLHLTTVLPQTGGLLTGLLFPLTGEDCILVTGCSGLCDICCVVLRKKPGGIVLRVVSVHLTCGPTPVQLWRLLKKFSLGTGQRWDELFWQGWFGPIFSARSLMCVFFLKAFNPVSSLTTTQYFSLFRELI